MVFWVWDINRSLRIMLFQVEQNDLDYNLIFFLVFDNMINQGLISAPIFSVYLDSVSGDSKSVLIIGTNSFCFLTLFRWNRCCILQWFYFLYSCHYYDLLDCCTKWHHCKRCRSDWLQSESLFCYCRYGYFIDSRSSRLVLSDNSNMKPW